MKKENILLVLWIVFGFLFLTAFNSILYFLIYLIYFGLYELGVSYSTLKIAIPITTLILYGLTTYILLKRVDITSKISGIYLMNFPIKLSALVGVIAFSLYPITKKLANLHRGYSALNENSDRHEYIKFYGWLEAGFGISRFIVIIILLIILLPKLQILKINSSAIEKSHLEK